MMYSVIGFRNDITIEYADCVIIKEGAKFEVMTYMPSKIIATCSTLQEARSRCYDLGFIME